ncbi:SDR family oxidoreductase [Saccharospirillum salsuginis]|uniref:3-ketoacyl-ACP reductase n=1 Tax=Saccharospirillum salsuginis TaxID=418750 RepID=A0A918KIT4_9GAMM|nr:SDR family oxidoreductase [Saccharospirillum salsuginis]GGX65424.1 3-ketoacyl-ACP reductase [Saccharospirillum salsuginis]
MTESTQQFQGKHIGVTGGARGLGLAMARTLGRQGAQISIVDIDETAVDEAVNSLTQDGIAARGYTANVAEEASVLSLFERLKADHNRLDGWVNNAGILRDGLLIKQKDGELTKLSLNQWQSVIDVNLTGVFLCGREAAAWMVESQTAGVIVNISSISRVGNLGQTNYSAAKAGVAAMTVTWAKELARYGIRVAGVAPGFIETEMTASMKPEALERVNQAVPLKRMGKPENIAEAVSFVIANDYYSGRILEVDGALRI